MMNEVICSWPSGHDLDLRPGDHCGRQVVEAGSVEHEWPVGSCSWPLPGTSTGPS